MATPNILSNYNAAVQAKMRRNIVQLKQRRSPTRGTLTTRSEGVSLSGLEIPYKQGLTHGSTALDPYRGQTSFEPMVAPLTNKMFVGLAFMGCTVEFEHFHNYDANKGDLPETADDLKKDVFLTYMQEQNWYAIGVNNGSLAIVSVGGGSGTITFTNDGTARGRSKGSIRLAVSPTNVLYNRVEYESYTPGTDTKTATFYITSKASATTAVVVVTDGGTLVAGDVIVKKGHYKKVPYGLGYHIDSTNRASYQGANTTADTSLNSLAVDGGAALVTPTVIDDAKMATQIAANDANARFQRVFHLTISNYKTLSAFGYTLRQYNAEGGRADTTFGLPYVYQDEDSLFVQDADMEDAYIYCRDRKSLFEVTQAPLQEISRGVEQYAGVNLVGSSEFHRNWGESFNIAYDGRGDDAKEGEMGSPNSSVVISNLTIPAQSQVSQGRSLV